MYIFFVKSVLSLAKILMHDMNVMILPHKYKKLKT